MEIKRIIIRKKKPPLWKRQWLILSLCTVVALVMLFFASSAWREEMTAIASEESQNKLVFENEGNDSSEPLPSEKEESQNKPVFENEGNDSNEPLPFEKEETQNKSVFENEGNDPSEPLPFEKEETQNKSASQAPVVALTFDDGPSSTVTPKLVEALNKRGVKATFFMLGKAAKANPEIVKMVYDSGHQIASHTYDHGAYLTDLNDDQLAYQINETIRVIRDITGEAPTYMRPPYGAMDPGTAGRIGWPMILWTVDPRDWDSRDGDKIFDAVINTVQNGSVVLFHDLYESTYEAVIKIVDRLIMNGWRFVTLEEYFSHYNVIPQPGKVYRGIEQVSLF